MLSILTGILIEAWRYIGDHWQGRQSLAWSFWVNLAAVRAVIYGIETRLRPPTVTDAETALILNSVFLVVTLGVVLPWQVVGVLRASTRYQKDGGTMALALGSYVGVAVAVIFTASAVFTTWQAVYREGAMTPEGEITVERWARERAARYSLTVSPDRIRLHLKGSIEPGLSGALSELLAANKSVRALVLESTGGHIYEGRAVAKLVLARRLDTHVERICASACTTAYLAGANRTLAPGGRIGFHQYAFTPGFGTPIDNRKEEQEKDRAFFAARGVSPAFLGTIFDTPHTSIWFPETGELLNAGVVHEIAYSP